MNRAEQFLTVKIAVGYHQDLLFAPAGIGAREQDSTALDFYTDLEVVFC